jgi:peptide/nickel transport system permease protein
MATVSMTFRKFVSRHAKSSLGTFFAGLTIVAAILTIVFLAPLIAPYSPVKIVPTEVKLPPSSSHWMGTDYLGRDVFSRVIMGGRTSMMVAVIAVSVSLVVGVPLGAISAYLGGKSDKTLTMIMDTFYAFPVYITALMLSIVLAPTARNISIAIGTAYIPQYFRIVRSITLSLREKMFIEAERSLGAGGGYIVFHHILPYTISSLTVLMSMGVADSILTVAGLGFLGIGIRPPTPEWGTDLRYGRDYFLVPTGGWWMAFFPGMAIFFAVVGFNLLSEGMNQLFQERGGGSIGRT